jgi:hypothetical protein
MAAGDLGRDAHSGEVGLEVEERGPGDVTGEVQLTALGRVGEVVPAVDEAVVHGFG